MTTLDSKGRGKDAPDEAADKSPTEHTLEIVDEGVSPPDLQAAKGFTVLLVGHDRESREKVRDALPSGYELVTAQGDDAGVRAARICAPDVILFDTANGDLKTLVTLKADPVADDEDDVVERWPHASVAEEVRRSVNVVELRGLIAAVVEGAAPGERLLQGDLGEASLADVVDFVHRELDHWVLEAAGPGAGKIRIKLGQSGDLMGALWAFVARMRELVAKGSDGAVNFRALEDGRVSMLSISTAVETEIVDDSDIVSSQSSAESITQLKGLRAVVADDDDEVRALFSGVLQEVGMEVKAVKNGLEALESVRRRRPDVVITDILMPEMDGWELLKHLRHDVLLQDLPVVVLSWKEDFLQRMKELEADANGFMKKEMDRNQILLKISDVLSSRLVVERQLAEEETFAGRVEAIGVVPLLRALARNGGDRQLVVREAWNLFEVDFRDGRLINVRDTTTGGRSYAGMAALRMLIGVRRGRFTVNPLLREREGVFESELSDLLNEAARPIQEMVVLVDQGAIVRVARVKLRAEVLREVEEIAPRELKHLIKRLAADESPRELILSGEISPQELELVMLDLIRRGAVEGIEAPSKVMTTPVRRSKDEERWAVIGGELSAPRPASSREGERVSIPSDIPPSLVEQEIEQPKTRGVRPRNRIIIYLAIIAVTAIALSRLFGEGREADDESTSPSTLAPAGPRDDLGSPPGSAAAVVEENAVEAPSSDASQLAPSSEEPTVEDAGEEAVTTDSD